MGNAAAAVRTRHHGHAEFPGWENIGSLLRLVRFVRDHHHRVRRLALATDSGLADLAPRVAEHFVHAQVRGFGYDELDRAIAWAAESAEALPVSPAAGASSG